MNLSAFEQSLPDPEENKLSSIPCLLCQGPMSIGDEHALGICCACYWANFFVRGLLDGC